MVVEAGADAVGFIIDVSKSPRNLSMDEAKILMKNVPIFVETVAVTVPEDVNHLEKIDEELNPDAIQIHVASFLQRKIRERLPDARLIGAVQVKPDFTINTTIAVADAFDAILLDSYVPDKYGGTGQVHDWELSKRVGEAIRPKPLILAGGLRLENVKEAIMIAKPYAVDVSSGVESYPGIKDREKVLQFIKNAKETEV